MLAGHFLARGLPPEEVWLLLQDWNRHNQPPLVNTGLRKTFESILKAERRRHPAGRDIDELLVRCTDAGNAELFCHCYGDRLRYDHRRKRWLVWRGHWWTEDVDGKVMRLAIEAARRRHHEAVRIGNKDKRRSVTDWARKSESRQRLEATLAIARNLPPLADSGDHWDTDPWLLGVANGVVDLHTGKLLPGNPEDRITKHIDIAYDPTAQCPRWRRFVDEIFDGDASLVDFMWKAVGYSLTGDTTEQVFFILYGRGWNGKTTFLEVLLYVFGPYGHNTDMETFLASRYGSGHPTELAELAGKRFVIAVEPNRGRRLNEARLKALAGQDRRRGRFVYQRGFSWEPTEKVWLAVNDKPTVRDPSEGFWRKLHLVPFERQFKGDARDKELRQELKAEASGILRWAVEGCLSRQKAGLTPPEKVLAATQEYRAESDIVARFLEDSCILAPDAWVSSAMLREALERWSSDNGEHLKLTELNEGLKAGGCRPARRPLNGRQTRGWEGVGLRCDVTEGGEP